MRWTAASLLFAALPLPSPSAEPPAKEPPKTAPDSGAAKLRADLAAMTDSLAKTPAWSVAAESQWKAEGAGPASEGKAFIDLAVRNPERFRLRIRPDEPGKDDRPTPHEVTCVSDGKSLTTVAWDQKLYSVLPSKKPTEDLSDKTLVTALLHSSGLEFLPRPDRADFLLRQANRAEYLGEDTAGGKKARHYQLSAGGAQLELWVADDEPLVVQVRRTVSVPVRDKLFKMTTTSTLTWKRDAKFDDALFQLTPPEGAKKVEDVYAALANPEGAALLGKAPPALSLKLLGGDDFAPEAHKGKSVVALIFWATWAAPSVEEVAAMKKFVKAYSDKGVVFYAINSGEKPEVVEAFVKKSEPVSKIVLDPKGTATDTFGLTKLPTVVLLGKDGTVQAVLTRPRDGDFTDVLGKDLDALLEGKSLVGK